MHWHTQTQKLTRAKYLLPVRFKVFHWDLLQHQGHPCSWCIFPSGQLRVLGCAPNSSGSWRPAACSTCAWSCRRCCTAQPLQKRSRHASAIPTMFLKYYYKNIAPDNKQSLHWKAAPLCAPGWVAGHCSWWHCHTPQTQHSPTAGSATCPST